MTNQKLQTACSFILVVAFFLTISVPLFRVNAEKKISHIENKVSAPFPTDEFKSKKWDSAFFQKLDTFFTDNIGFREEALTMDTLLSYRLFSKIKCPMFLSANEQELFFDRGKKCISTFQAKPADPERVEKIVSRIESMKLFCEKYGVDFVLLTIPDKENVYPELYPKSVKRFSDSTLFDNLADYLQAETSINTVHLRDPLRNKKGWNRLYYKNYDCSHWNMHGAFVGIVELITRIKQMYPEVEIPREEEYTITVEETQGGPLNFQKSDLLRKGITLKDTKYIYAKKEKRTARIVNPGKYENHFVNPAKKGTPKVLIVGDSYVKGSCLGILAEYFSELQFVHHTAGSAHIQHIFDQFSPDIVVLEVVERANYNDFRFAGNFGYLVPVPSPFRKIPEVKNKPSQLTMQEITPQKAIEIDDTKRSYSIRGKIDAKIKMQRKNVYVVIGDQCYRSEPEYSSPKSEKDFMFRLPVNKLSNEKKFSLIAVDPDDPSKSFSMTYQVTPSSLLADKPKESVRR